MRLERENAVVCQMELLHKQQLREQKIRQSIHETSPELRELEKKLNAAYTNKERAIQLVEKKLAVQELRVCCC